MCFNIEYYYDCKVCGKRSKGKPQKKAPRLQKERHGRSDGRVYDPCDEWYQGKCNGKITGPPNQYEGIGECPFGCPKVYEEKIEGDKYVGKRSAAQLPYWTSGDSQYTTYPVGRPDEDDESIIPSSSATTPPNQSRWGQHSMGSRNSGGSPPRFESPRGTPPRAHPSSPFQLGDMSSDVQDDLSSGDERRGHAKLPQRSQSDQYPQYAQQPQHPGAGLAGRQSTWHGPSPLSTNQYPSYGNQPQPYGYQQQPYGYQQPSAFQQQPYRAPPPRQPTGGPVVVGSSTQPNVGVAISGDLYDPARTTVRRDNRESSPTDFQRRRRTGGHGR